MYAQQSASVRVDACPIPILHNCKSTLRNKCFLIRAVTASCYAITFLCSVTVKCYLVPLCGEHDYFNINTPLELGQLGLNFKTVSLNCCHQKLNWGAALKVFLFECSILHWQRCSMNGLIYAI